MDAALSGRLLVAVAPVKFVTFVIGPIEIAPVGRQKRGFVDLVIGTKTRERVAAIQHIAVQCVTGQLISV